MEIPSTNRATAARVVDRLVSDGLLASGDADRAQQVVAGELGAGAGAPAVGGMSRLVEVVAYLGGALVGAAGLLFLVQNWDDLGETGQVLALGLVAAVLAVAGLVARPRRAGTSSRDARRRLAGTLFTGAAVAAGFATGLGLDYALDRDWDDFNTPTVVAGVVVAILSLVGYRLAPTEVGVLGIFGGVLVSAATSLVSDTIDEATWVGLACLIVSVVWVAVTEAGAFPDSTTARVLGAGGALFGAQLVALSGPHSNLGYLLTALVCAAGVLLYLARLEWPYLAVAVLAVTLVVPEAVTDWTDDSLGTVGGVLLAGITLLAASFAGYRLREEATDQVD